MTVSDDTCSHNDMTISICSNVPLQVGLILTIHNYTEGAIY